MPWAGIMGPEGGDWQPRAKEALWAGTGASNVQCPKGVTFCPKRRSFEHKDIFCPFRSPEITNPAILGLDSILKCHLGSHAHQRKVEEGTVNPSAEALRSSRVTRQVLTV